MLDLAACTIVSVRNGEVSPKLQCSSYSPRFALIDPSSWALQYLQSCISKTVSSIHRLRSTYPLPLLDKQSFDAYVLSESSLFVYPTKMVLKTCGTTKLLNAVSRALDLAAAHGLRPQRVKYSRASFLFPEFQPTPHSSWTEECKLLQTHFGGFKGGPSAYVLGDQFTGLQWHVYVADAEGVAPPTRTPTYTLEVVMTELARSAARNFYRTDDFVSAAHTTKTSGIRDIFPEAEIDDYVFEPCGYSMNGLEGNGFSTIHITPEPDCSYASCELSCYPCEKVDVSDRVRRIVKAFRPGKMTVTVTTDTPGAYAWAKPMTAPAGFVYNGASVQELPCGGRVVFYHFTAASQCEDVESPNTVLNPVALSSSASGLDFEDLIQTPMERSAKGSPRTMTDSPVSTHSLSAALKLRLLPKPLIALVEGDHALLAALEKYRTVPLASGSEAALMSYASKLIEAHHMEDNVYLFDLANVVRAYRGWTRMFPRIRPFYAVKCMPLPAYISVLQALGAGFDCASQTELDLAVSLGADAARDLIFAQPCKRHDELRHAAAIGVRYSTFDSVCELEKVAACHPGCGVVLRIKADDPQARCQLGNKFGAYCNAQIDEVPALLAAAKRLGLDLCGVSFHVGSGSSNPEAFAHAIQTARRVFDDAHKLGFNMRLLDIGGGFCAIVDEDGEVSLGAVSAAINAALDAYFPVGCGVEVIAEPGRYFAEYAGTMFTQVYGKRPHKSTGQMHYWVTDGLYGSMNCVLYDHAQLRAKPLYSPLLPPVSEAQQETLISTTVFGPTCDGLDTVLRNVMFPELRIGDWVSFQRMGAYTIAGATDFNGIKVRGHNRFSCRFFQKNRKNNIFVDIYMGFLIG